MPDTEFQEGTNKCEQCGACCALFKITFSLSEGEAEKDGGVPTDLTLADGISNIMMKGTEKGYKRCIALKGNVGYCVRCMIYDRRPSPCRDFKAAWMENVMNDQCNRARAVYGLAPFDFI